MGGNILETFYLLFTSDTANAEKGLDDLDDKMNKVEQTGKKLETGNETLGSSFLSVAKSIGLVAAGFMAANRVLNSIFDAANVADNLNDLSQSIGINIEDLSMWGDAVKMSGGTAEGFQGSIRSLATSMAVVDVTGKSRLLPFFKELGISMTDAAGKMRQPLELLPEIASAFEGMSKAQSLGIGQKLGLDQGTILLLQSGRRALDDVLARQKELGVVTQKQAEVSAAYNDVIDENAHRWRTFVLTLAEGVLPVFTVAANALGAGLQFVNENGRFFLLGLTALTAYLVAAVIPAMKILKIETLLATWPIVAIAAAIAAFILVIDDLVAYFNGENSITGKLIEFANSFPAVKAFIDYMKADFQQLIDILSAVGEAFGKVKGFFSGLFGGGKVDGLMKGQLSIANASMSPIGALSSGGITNSTANQSNKSTSMQVGTINVQTQATDAQGIAGDITGGLHSQMRQAAANADDGILG